jgi:Lipid A 3-O-deacylase (PagL)
VYGLILALVVPCAGQTGSSVQLSTQQHWLGATGHLGYVVAHAEKVANIQAHGHLLELTYSSQPNPMASWAQFYPGARYGLSVLVANFGQPNLTGYAVGFIPHLELGIGPRHRHFPKRLVGRLGTGIGYFTRTFYTDAQFKNRAIASHFNGCMQVGLQYLLPVLRKPTAHAGTHHTRQHELVLGLMLTHFSNGKVQEPNWGINTFSLNAGLRFGLPPRVRQTAVAAAQAAFNPRWFGLAQVSGGTKEAGYINPKRYAVVALATEWGRSFARVSHLSIGLDAVWHPFVGEYAIDLQDTTTQVHDLPFRQKAQLFVRLGHEARFGRLGILTQLGTYVYTPSNEQGTVITRLGVRYWPTDHFFTSITLKSLIFTADYIDFAIGFRFK